MPLQPRLILASSSIYRLELLSRLNVDFSVCSPDIDETPLQGEQPAATALRLARQKAQAVALSESDAIVIGSDQVAMLDGEPIGKPGTHEKALAQLKKMQGRSVVFHTALCVLDGRAGITSPHLQTATVDTTVVFRTYPDQQLDAYLRIEQPYDCAGSAKNEGLGIALIDSIRSDDPTALTGLPLIALTRMLMLAGFVFFNGAASR